MVAAALSALLALGHLAAAGGSAVAALRRATPLEPARGSTPPRTSGLRGHLQGKNTLPENATLVHASSNVQKHGQGAPCTCEPNGPWQPCARTVPKCIFIDLGAADGNTFRSFLDGAYGPVANCPSGQWEAMLVEANPRFDAPLQQLNLRFPGAVTVLPSTAAYMCEATTAFYLDTMNHQRNYWGSSMSSSHPDVQNSGLQKVNVQMMNLNRLLSEKTIAGDWVMVKMDIEGAEWDVIPCLAQAPAAALIDRLYMEVHNISLSLTGTTQDQFVQAENMLRQRGVDIPQYFSQTF